MNNKQIKVLLVEDNPGDVCSIQEMMSEVADVKYKIECVNRLDTGLERLAKGGIDLVLLDLGLPDSQGFDTFRKVHSQAGEAPIVVLTGLDNEELGLKAVKMGAQDYLLKDQVYGNLLVRTVRYAIERKKIDEALKKRTHDLGERVKELNCLFEIDEISRKEGITIEELLKKTTRLLPPGGQYPEITGSCITFKGKKYKTRNFKKTKWMLRADIIVKNNKAGSVEVCYLEEKPEIDQGPFLKEEKTLINSVSNRLGQLIERREAEKELRKRKEFSEGLINAMQDGFSALDPNGVHIKVNEALCKMTGFTRRELIGTGPPHLYWPPEEYENTQKAFEKTLQGEFKDFELVFMRKNGERFPVIVSPSWLKNEQGEIITYFASVKDITERKQAEEKIKASLREKEALLQEIYHRVKNNMQIISSLIKLQSEHITDEKALGTFKSTQNRVHSMALIHERLYKSKDLARVDFEEYVRGLTNQLFSTYGIDPKAIKLNVDIKDVLLDINTAIPCGLIVNELVSNSLKHAFPDSKKGEIKIAMQYLNKNEIKLIVSDNGAGLPKEVDFKRTKSLGLHLVTILAEDQLHGKIKLDRTDQTR